MKAVNNKLYIDRLLGDEPQYIKDKFQYDLESVNYITHLNIAREIATKAKNISDKIGIVNSTVLDAFACVGGNTIAFAEVFPRVIANEINKTRFNMLKNNMFLFSGSATYHNKDVIDLMKDSFAVDVIFIDPPWNDGKIIIGNLSLKDFIADILSRFKIKIIIVKIPFDLNVDFIPESYIKNDTFDIEDYSWPNRMRIVYFYS